MPLSTRACATRSRSRFSGTSALLPLLALLTPIAVAQDSTPAAGEPIVAAIDVAALQYDYLVNARLAQDDAAGKKFRTLQAAYDAAPAGTAEKPTVIGLAPGVYRIPAPAGAITGLTITKPHLTLLGLTNNRRAVVLADDRGNRMGGGDVSGGSSNGYVVMIKADGFTARNLTFLNFCNVDYEYPGDPSKNLRQRSATITQAVALDAVGDRHHYENVAFCSRLDTAFIRTTRSYFKNVFIEGTDDFIGGGQVGVWEDCEIHFPTGSGVCLAGNIAFLRCRFTATDGMQFWKGPGRGVALIDCTLPVHSDAARVAWVRGKAPPRPSLNYVTYRTKDAQGNPAVVTDGSAGEMTFTYSRELSDREALAFNPWNMLRAAPNGTVDNWDPAGVRARHEASGAGDLVFRLALTGSPATVRTGGATATLGASVIPARATDNALTWSTTSDLITLSRTAGPDVVVSGRNPGKPMWVPVTATTSSGFLAQAWVFVEPAFVAAPVLTRGPTLTRPAGGRVSVDYAYDLGDREDQSVITWSACKDANGSEARDVAVSRGLEPLKTYPLAPGDVGKFLRVAVQPKHNVSDPGPAIVAIAEKPIAAAEVASTAVTPNFRHFVTTANGEFVSGRWTVLGTWTSVTDESFPNGYGVRAGSQGAQLLYQNDAPTGDMQVELVMTPEKSEGSGFGSPGGSADGERVQKADLFIKYDPRTQTGYALRFWRTTESAKKCRFQFFRIVNGVGTPLDDQQAFTGVFKPTTTFTLRVAGDRISARARNDVDDETLALDGTIVPNAFGGAGVAWFGTVPRGNSNVYSRFDITFPDAASPRSATSE